MMDNNMNIQITIGEHTLYKNYELVDGRAPENMQEIVQEMVDLLLDSVEI